MYHRHIISILFLATSIFAQDSLYSSQSGDTLTIHHVQTERNCGALFTYDVSLIENLITITEVDTGGQAWCMCYFDLEISLIGIDPGAYQVDVWSNDIGLDPVFHGSLQVDLGDLNLIDQWESGCLAAREDSSFIELTVLGDSLNLFWNTPLMNCALEPTWIGYLSADTFHVTMVDTGEPADCICPFELNASFASFQPGTYTFDFWNGEYGYPTFDILNLRSDPAVANAYQSPCYDPVSIGDEGDAARPEKAILDVVCFPNPFNPSASISYFITSSGSVSLKIYDLRGSLVRELDQGNQSSGDHTINISAEGMKSGVYLYRLESEHFHVINKLIILK